MPPLLGRWLAGIAAAALVAALGGAFGVWREWDRGLVEIRAEIAAQRARVDDLDRAMRSNEHTRMAPETKSEIDSLRREVDSLGERLRALERRR